VTDSPSEAEVVDAEDGAEPAPSEDAAFAAEIAELVGATSWSDNFGVARVVVDRDGWVEAAAKVRDHGMPLFSWLSAIDWAKDVEVGEPVASPDDLEERFEIICRLSSVRTAASVHLVTTVPKDDAQVPSLTGEFAGAEWHEREAAEMFGIEFPGNPGSGRHLYLPDEFEGNPLLKSYPLLSREVKPWPGTVDVEDMPSTENVEAAAQEAAAEDAEGDGA
jgi:NADH-quinone oxidoreductase subunit C